MEDYIVAFKSLSDRTRLRILRMLLEAGNGLCVCEMMDSLEVKQYNISSHLKELKIAGLVKERREGRFIFYELNKQKNKFLKYLFKVVLSIPEEMFKLDIKRLKKRLSLRIGNKVIVNIKKRNKK